MCVFVRLCVCSHPGHSPLLLSLDKDQFPPLRSLLLEIYIESWKRNKVWLLECAPITLWASWHAQLSTCHPSLQTHTHTCMPSRKAVSPPGLGKHVKCLLDRKNFLSAVVQSCVSRPVTSGIKCGSHCSSFWPGTARLCGKRQRD